MPDLLRTPWTEWALRTERVPRTERVLRTERASTPGHSRWADDASVETDEVWWR